jgi:predicted AAA+ superfamily ATPase
MMDKSSHSEINYVFLDEIQEIKDFEKCIITLFENKQFKYDIYITGSNSKMFSEKLATLFTGRSAPINVFPISFKLFHEQLNNEYSNNSLFNKYLKYGGLGIIVPNYDEENLIQKTLK